MIFFNIIKSIIYGIVEGITEWIPVSSTGHMIILEKIIPLDMSGKFFDLFMVCIQLGAIIAIILIYYDKLMPFFKKDGNIMFKPKSIILWRNIIISCIPAVIYGVLFDELISKYLYNYYIVSLMLIIIGIIFIIVENSIISKKPKFTKLAEVTPKIAFILGLGQVVAAIFPGTSRSGIIIIISLLLGMSRINSVEYAFLLGVPIMLGASILKVIKYLANYGVPEILDICYLLISMLVSFFVSIVVIGFILNYIKRNNFKIFGYYRIALGCFILLLFGFVF